MFARLALKSGGRWDHPVSAMRLKPISQPAPVVIAKHHTEMRHRHHMRADLTGVGGLKWFAQMQAELVAEEAEIDPTVCGSPLLTPQQVAVKAARGVQISDIQGKVERGQHGVLRNKVLKTIAAGEKRTSRKRRRKCGSNVRTPARFT